MLSNNLLVQRARLKETSRFIFVNTFTGTVDLDINVWDYSFNRIDYLIISKLRHDCRPKIGTLLY